MSLKRMCSIVAMIKQRNLLLFYRNIYLLDPFAQRREATGEEKRVFGLQFRLAASLAFSLEAKCSSNYPAHFPYTPLLVISVVGFWDTLVQDFG